MLFNSFSFLIFYPIVLLLFFWLPHKLRWIHLLVTSCIFYAAFIPAYLLILFAVILIDFMAGILIERSYGSKRKWLLLISILSNLGILFVFKYYNFFVGNLSGIFPGIPLLNMVLPIGLSFHTFQAMSYTIEVYRGNQVAEKHLGIYALYVMFFPQLVAGPIERPQNMIPQFHLKQYFNYDNAVSGLRLMLWGFFKKIVIADRLAVFVDNTFSDLHNQSAVAITTAVFFFTFQIYCDFSGYSDIAIGSARIMGFRLMKNFNAPYIATSIADFWTRWHISLSTWFRDYLYIPLGGNRVALPRWICNIFIVFLISGFWHGANWTFIAWGGLHGVYLLGNKLMNINEKMNRFFINRVPLFVQGAFTFLLVSVSWTFFRSESIADAWFVLKKMSTVFTEAGNTFMHKTDFYAPVTGGFLALPIFSFLLIIFLWLTEWWNTKQNIAEQFKKKNIVVRWGVYLFFVAAILFLGAFRESKQFIYFQF